MQSDLFLHPFTKLLTIIFIMITSFFVVFLLGFLLAIPVFGMSFGELSGLLSDYQISRHPGMMKYFQIVQTMGLFVIPPFIAARFLSHRPFSYLSFDARPTSGSVLTVIVLIFISLPFINFLAQVNQNIHLPRVFDNLEQWLMTREESARQMTDQFLQARDLSGLAVNLVMVAILPAVGEELIFRGIIQKIFSEWTKNMHWGIVIAAFLFSAMHVQFYGLIPRMFLGILFGYLLVWSGSIWLPVLAHFVNNAAAVIYFYVASTGVTSLPEGYQAIGMQWPVVVFSLAMIGLCCYVIFFNEKRSGLAG